uniref:Uncharacterized protein n=1 Tax=Candidatus Kentrum sp. SD TaxID=2126332 RepID=A0A451BIY9_9GAMM|nr:MAG: hypothetical protein BECKSD772F_GA0070984_102812 [Candidatus Kentron sp. SD]VFK43568.1 MAG: hypothetical protein BECKSD772E_GA0070983_102712 [Candidatus Kentron sp. SD]VFK78237.1 MAG: hypothetical protein BECKSD772D_GA0070982_10105 [Candidatus Kentron sp. SD]
MLNKSITALTLALLFSARALADECVCLIDKDDGILFDCRIHRDEKSEQAQYFCANPKAADEWFSVHGGHLLELARDGEPPCTPCRLSDMKTRDLNAIRHGP